MADESPDKKIQITQKEKEDILMGVKLMNSNTNDVGEIVLKPFRMCGFVPMNIPILCGILLSAPTMRNTIFFQWLNQSYNAGLNFGNKNSTCQYTNTDLLKGYFAAIGSSVSVAMFLRLVTAGATKRATGTKLLLLNCMVGSTAGACASFCNTMCMRYAEIEKGINVCEDADLKKTVGISKVCAKSAVVETSLSRSAMSMSSVMMPCGMIVMLGAVGVAPQSFAAKTSLEFLCIAGALRLGLPMSVSIFPPISQKETEGSDLEEEFRKYKTIYFSKGL